MYHSFSVQCYSPLNFSTIISIRVGKSRERVESLELYAIRTHLGLLFHQEAQEADVEIPRNQDAASFCIFIGGFFSYTELANPAVSYRKFNLRRSFVPKVGTYGWVTSFHRLPINESAVLDNSAEDIKCWLQRGGETEARGRGRERARRVAASCTLPEPWLLSASVISNYRRTRNSNNMMSTRRGGMLRAEIDGTSMT